MFYSKKGIIIKIAGGLGNQLFQYAIGRFLSLQNNTELVLDTSFFKDDRLYDRMFLLNQFNIKADYLSDVDFIKSKNLFTKRILKYYKKAEKIFGIDKRHFIDEPLFMENEHLSHRNYLNGGPYNSFSADVLNNKNKFIIIDGYWQSEKYFKSIESIIREDLKIIKPLPSDIQVIADNLRNKNSVCIGIRQYSDSPASASHFKLTSDYYKKAIELISEQINNPEFFVFTLEKQWVVDNIKTDFPLTIIEPADSNETAYIDLYLMSQCNHFIIANSTYHWWGAWLSENKDKIVIAPERGWGNECAVPDEWIKL